jgi:hypothetical protein
VAAPKWASPAKDPTHKVGRDGKPRPASSIFQLFKQGGGKFAFNLTGNARDVQVGVVVVDKWYLTEQSTNSNQAYRGGLLCVHTSGAGC